MSKFGLVAAWLIVIAGPAAAQSAQVPGPDAAAPPAAATAPDTSMSRGDYPTVVLADYVLGCMKANDESRQTLERCSCSIDVITTLIPYSRYEEAETFLSMGLVAGERGVIFRTSRQATEAVGALRQAQIEAELRCF